MAKPVVDGIERELSGEADVIRINVLSSAGREAIYRFGVRAVPTLVVLDGCGEVVERQVGILNPGRVVEAARSAACVPGES